VSGEFTPLRPDGCGGGILNFDGTLQVANSTIVENIANAGNEGGCGGGVYTLSGSATVSNTIVAGNVNGTSAQSRDDWQGLVPIAAGSSYNLIGDATTSGGLVNGLDGNIVGVDDLSWIAPLGSYGGTTRTQPQDDSVQDRPPQGPR
jgi:hypothetical protein